MLIDAGNLWQILFYGWQVNLVLVIFGCLTLWWSGQVLYRTRRTGIAPTELFRHTFDDLVNNDLVAARARLAEKKTLLADVVEAGLNTPSRALTRVTAMMESAGKRGLNGIRRKINYLAYLGTLSPLIGMFGTIIGLTKTVAALNTDGTERLRHTLITAHLGEALGTTIVGLFIGIMATAAYFLCLSRWERRADDLAYAAENLALALAERGEAVERDAPITRETSS